MKSKLIRDSIHPTSNDVSVIWAPDIRIQIALLVGKLHEESQEIAEDITEAEEYADLLTVMRQLAKLGGVDFTQVEKIAAWKEAERGGFTCGRVLHRPKRRRAAA